jgi:TolB-like protein/DNA-binding winged helix-turn-helix (wHTH) protein/tetratricopeptide (TPR) repeat protein
LIYGVKTASQAQNRGIPVPPEPAAFRLGEVDVLPASGQVSGPGGTRQLDPKVMEVLLRLAAAGGEVVSRETLMADVWEGLVVSDFALSRCIYQLRKNLGKVSGSEDSPIETLSKRGYRLIWPVSAAAEPAVAHPTIRRSLISVVVVILTLVTVFATWLARDLPVENTSRPAIAVMPFTDLTKAGDLAYFGDGIATALQTELGHITEIDVIAHSSSFYFRGRQASVAEIGAVLNAAYLLEGSVNSEGEAVQLTAALVDVANGRQVWSRTFMGVAGQSFTAQQDMAVQIAGYLDVSLGDPRKHGGTSNFEALEMYLRALESVDTADTRLMDFYLDQALAYDPEYAQALVARAFAIYVRFWQGDGAPEHAWAEAKPLLDRALEITDELPGAYVLIAGFQIERKEYGPAEAALERALEINPSHSGAFVHLSRLMEQTGRLQESVALAERTVRLDPLNAYRHIQLASRRWTAGDFKGGKASYERALELDPLNYAGWSDYGWRLGDLEGEVAGFRLVARLQENPEFRSQFIGPNPELTPKGVGLIALWLGFIGDFERELEMLELQFRLGDNGHLRREMAWSLLAQGDLEGARKEAWVAIGGMPRDIIVNYQVAEIALRSGVGMDEVLAHYRRYWPGLFQDPLNLGDVPREVIIGAALISRVQGQEERVTRLLETLLVAGEDPFSIRAMAKANLEDFTSALDELENHINNGGYFSYFPGDPMWAPLVGEPRFMAIVDAEAAKDALAREQVDAMIASGELILPGHEDS